MAGIVTNPGSLETIGNALLEAAKTVDTKPVKTQLTAFQARHKAWLAAHAKTMTAKAREQELRLNRSELDAKQDLAVDALAAALAGDGFDRLNPFKSFGGPSPSRLKEMGDEQEAVRAIALAAAVQKDKKASAATRKAAQVLAAAAKPVIDASKAVVPAAATATAQRNQREALVSGWGKAYALLRMAAKLEEDSGGAPLYSTLFPTVSRPKRKPAPRPVTTATVATAG
jgi:hypothetical protein